MLGTSTIGETLVIRCVDKRYGQPEVRAQLPSGYDLTAAGASLWPLQQAHYLVGLFDQIRALLTAGVEATRIVVADHYCHAGNHGCKAYKALSDDSRESHERNLRRLALAIQAEPDFQALEVVLLLHDIDNNTIEEVTLSEPVPVEAVAI